MRHRTKACPVCGRNFSYEVGTGKDRTYCSDVCRYEQHKASHREAYKYLPSCVAPKCSGKATRSGGYCEACYCQLRRTGSLERKMRNGKYTTSAGYVAVTSKDHPLATKYGYVYEHRMVAWEKEGGDSPSCFWCGATLEWKDAVVDHLNEKKDDNRPENLVVSCSNCNRARGSVLPFVLRMKSASFDSFVDCMKDYRSHHQEKTARETR